MYVAPNTTIYLLKNVPLDNTYTDTIYTSSPEVQAGHFLTAYTKKTFNQQTYQRVNRNTLRLKVVADDIYDYNYLIFRNTSFGSKYFYAFVTQVEYINNETSEIQYEIDVMQTWLFDYALRPCYVEREHSASDSQIDILNRPESVDVGDIVCQNISNAYPFHYGILMTWVDDDALSDVGTIYNGNLFGGVKYTLYDMEDATEMAVLKTTLQLYNTATKRDNILSLCIVPYNTLSDDADAPFHTSINISKPTTIENYTPRNNKLLWFPFSFVTIDTTNDSKDFRYEWFDTSVTGNCEFDVVCAISSIPELSIYPVGYNGSGVGADNPTESVICKGFPLASWCANGFLNWLGEKTKDVIDLGISLGASVGLGAIEPADINKEIGLSGVFSGIASGATQSSRIKGTMGSSNEIARGLKGIYFKRMSITKSRAKMLDDYFDRYGYACGEVKVPNRNVRPCWCYCKTQNCNIVGSVPADAMRQIKSIYNNGITWWQLECTVGDYTQDNRV